MDIVVLVLGNNVGTIVKLTKGAAPDQPAFTPPGINAKPEAI